MEDGIELNAEQQCNKTCQNLWKMLKSCSGVWFRLKHINKSTSRYQSMWGSLVIDHHSRSSSRLGEQNWWTKVLSQSIYLEEAELKNIPQIFDFCCCCKQLWRLHFSFLHLSNYALLCVDLSCKIRTKQIGACGFDVFLQCTDLCHSLVLSGITEEQLEHCWCMTSVNIWPTRVPSDGWRSCMITQTLTWWLCWWGTRKTWRASGPSPQRRPKILPVNFGVVFWAALISFKE